LKQLYLDFNLFEPIVDAPPIGEVMKSTEKIARNNFYQDRFAKCNKHLIS
jgi:hypothetical protein